MPKHGTFTWGTTPKDAILAALKAVLGDKWYEMALNRPDAERVTRLVNQGIDSHLEAVTELRQRRGALGKLHLEFGHESLCVLLRRLLEDATKEDGNEESSDLRSSILTSLEIEEV